MKKLALILFLVALYPTLIEAQSKYGKTTQEELEMVSYPEDTTASAVILYKNGQLNFVYNDEKGFQFEFTQEMKIKILKTDGLGYADGEISYYVADRNSKEEITKLSGNTYNFENGKIVKTKLANDNIFEEEAGEKWKRKKFTMPATKVGSVIEYKYTIVSSFLYQLRDFYFQSSIPIDYVNFEAIIPEYFFYNLEQQGYIVLENSSKKPVNSRFSIKYRDDNGRLQTGLHTCNSDSYNFSTTKVPAARVESKLWTINDYISKVSFELKSTNMPGGFMKTYSTTWNNIDSDLLKDGNYGGNLKRSNWFKDIISSGDITLERANEILMMIKEKVKWNNSNSAYSSKLKETLNTGVGNSSDINYLLYNALVQAGFEPYPVLLSTRSNGRLPITHPSVTAFNNLIVGLKIDDKMYYTDASSKYGAWNVLPEKCMVERARIVSENYKDWVDLSTVSSGVIFRQVNVDFLEDGNLNTVSESRSGNDAYNFRSAYYSYENHDKFIEFVENKANSTIENMTLNGLEDNSATIKIQYKEKKNDPISLDANMIYYRPPLDKFYSTNPFTAETRTFPINFDYLQNYVQILTINIPKGYTVVEIPNSERIQLNDSDLIYSYSSVADENVIKINLRLQVKKLMFLPTDYQALKDFFGKMILKNEEQIILKKKEVTI